MRSILRPLLLCAALAAGVAGCESSTEPRFPSGSLSFTYSGAVSGTFRAEGRFTRQFTEDFAAAFAYFDTEENEPFLDLSGLVPRTGGRADGVDFFFPAVSGPTTISLDQAACTGEGGLLGPACGTGFLVFNATAQVSAAEAFVPVTGSIEVTAVEASRIRGTFSGTARRESDGATLQFTNGQFDVPLLTF